jgi:hypothetical protein
LSSHFSSQFGHFVSLHSTKWNHEFLLHCSPQDSLWIGNIQLLSAYSYTFLTHENPKNCILVFIIFRNISREWAILILGKEIVFGVLLICTDNKLQRCDWNY